MILFTLALLTTFAAMNHFLNVPILWLVATGIFLVAFLEKHSR